MSKEEKSTKNAPKSTETPKKGLKIKFKKPNFKNIKWGKAGKIALIVLGAIAVLGLIDFGFQYYRNGYSIAVINGKGISKREFYKNLEAAYGNTIATQMIEEEIIREEAKKGDISVSKEDVQTQLDEIIASVGGQEAYEKALVSSNITEEKLKEQIELDQLTQKLLSSSIEYTDEDLKDFFEQYSEIMFQEDAAQLEEGEKLDYEKYKDQVKEYYVQQMVQQKKPAWLAEKEDEYTIQNNASVKPTYGVFKQTVNIVRTLLDNANTNTQE